MSRQQCSLLHPLAPSSILSCEDHSFNSHSARSPPCSLSSAVVQIKKDAEEMIKELDKDASGDLSLQVAMHVSSDASHM